MLKGTNASSGIGIGNAVIVEEKELVIKRETVRDAAAEVERFKGALDLTLKKTEELAADLATRVGERLRRLLPGRASVRNMTLSRSAPTTRICSRLWMTN